MYKHIAIALEVDKAIRAIKKIEDNPSIGNSYSKITNYLITLGVERYNELARTKVAIPEFNFDKYYRRTKAYVPLR